MMLCEVRVRCGVLGVKALWTVLGLSCGLFSVGLANPRVLQACCARFVSVVVFSESRHFGQYLACLADSALWVTLILVHFGQWVRGLPPWKL